MAAGINPLAIINFYPELCHEKSCTGPFSVFTLDILFLPSLYKNNPNYP